MDNQESSNIVNKKTGHFDLKVSVKQDGWEDLDREVLDRRRLDDLVVYRDDLRVSSNMRQLWMRRDWDDDWDDQVSRKHVEGYEKCLSQGKADVAYGRVMLIGPGGVGKTSLRRGLMGKLYTSERSSTVVAKVQSLRPIDAVEREWMGHKWLKITEEDELDELAHLIAAVHVVRKDSKSEITSSQIEKSVTQAGSYIDELKKVMDTDIVEKSIKKAIVLRQSFTPFKCLPFYHVWDCGGQPMFLEVLPAFLTAHTMFLILFDASKSLHDKLESIQYQKGERQGGEIMGISALELMEGWMSCVHAQLLERDKENVPLEYPRVIPIGTRGDEVRKNKKEQEVLAELGQLFKGKAFCEVLREPVIIDNTTAGSAKNEDPGYKRIREEIREFTVEKLKKPTPITWVLFRRFVQLIVKKKSIISLDEAKITARACKISEKDVSRVLTFYHELGVLLYYPHIEGLQDTVILNPQWFVECLGKVLALKGQEEAAYERKPEWVLLRSKGILLQSLYETVWRQYAGIKPEALVNLLVKFQLAVEISTDEWHSSGRQFFVPAVLAYSTVPFTPLPPSYASNKVAPLHITFKEGYVVPGYFIRLVAMMQKSPLCSLKFAEVFHDQVAFSFKANLVTLVQNASVIQVHLQCLLPKSVCMKKDCQSLQNVLNKSCQEVEKCLHVCQGKKQWERLKVVCEAEECQSYSTHYLSSQPASGYISCERAESYREMKAEEACWFSVRAEEEDLEDPPQLTVFLNRVTAKLSYSSDRIAVHLLNPDSYNKFKRVMASQGREGDNDYRVLYDEWKSEGSDFTWEKIIKVLECPSINECTLAKSLRASYVS